MKIIPNAQNNSIDNNFPTKVGNSKITIIGKKYDSVEHAFKTLRKETIQKQLDALQELGKNASKGDKASQSLLKNIADNKDIKSSYNDLIQSKANNILTDIENDEDDTPTPE